MNLLLTVALIVTFTYFAKLCVDNNYIVLGSILFLLVAASVIYLIHERDKQTCEV